MTVTKDHLDALAARLSVALQPYSAKVTLSIHFSADRVNDLRNRPPITIAELEDVFMRFVVQHMASVVTLGDNDTFNIRCTKSHINMPCGLRKYSSSPQNRMVVITIMRRENFFAKDPVDYHVL